MTTLADLIRECHAKLDVEVAHTDQEFVAMINRILTELDATPAPIEFDVESDIASASWFDSDPGAK